MNNLEIKTVIDYLITGKKEIDYNHAISQLILNSDRIDNFGIHNGLVGLGWVLEYCYYNKLICGDTNEILQEIDNILYQRVMLIHRSDRLYVDDAFYLLLYYHRRTQNGRYYSHIHRNYSILPCLRILMYRIDHYLFSTNTDKLVGDIHISLILLKYASIDKNFQISNSKTALNNHLNGFLRYLENKIFISPHECIVFFLRGISLKYFKSPSLQNMYASLYHKRIKNIEILEQEDETGKIISSLEKVYLLNDDFGSMFTYETGDLSPLATIIFLSLLDVGISN